MNSRRVLILISVLSFSKKTNKQTKKQKKKNTKKPKKFSSGSDPENKKNNNILKLAVSHCIFMLISEIILASLRIEHWVTVC